MNFSLRALCITCFSLFASLITAQVVISELSSDGMVKLKNLGTDTVDVSQYWLCNRPEYERVGSLTTGCGDTNLTPGDSVVLNLSGISITGTGGELALYINSDFTISAGIRDYVYWGVKNGTTREAVAVAAGIWTNGDRASTFTTLQSLHYDGSGNLATDYFAASKKQCSSSCDVLGGNLLIQGTSSTNLTICAGDGQADPVDVDLSGNSGQTKWVVTDTAGKIIALPANPPFDFEAAGPGICLIWHLAYRDSIGSLAVGKNKSELTGCFSFSNAIAITRDAVSGGKISATEDKDTLFICSGDGRSDSIAFTLSMNVGENGQWIIADDKGRILGLPGQGVVDFETAGAGTCIVWYLSYKSGLVGLETGRNIDSLNGCYDFSNPITLIRSAVQGGELSTLDGLKNVNTCVGDGIPDPIQVNVIGDKGEFSAWIITDENNKIIGLPLSPPFDFESVGPGVAKVYRLSFNGIANGLTLGANVLNISGCYALSNALQINRKSVSPSQIMTKDSLTSIVICTGDGKADLTQLTSTGGLSDSTLWLVTNESGIIQSLSKSANFDLESSGSGTSLIWLINYNGNLAGAEKGFDVKAVSGCLKLSNSIEVVSKYVNGGNLMTVDSLTELSICSGDGKSDPIQVKLGATSGDSSRWIVTDINGKILGLPSIATFDFEAAGAGKCQIWNVSYNGNIVGLALGLDIDNLQGCFDLSNPIVVTRNLVKGGTLTTGDGKKERVICTGDGQRDAFDVIISGSDGAQNGWIITDTSGRILDLPVAPPFDFEGVAGGLCQIWHISYSSGLSGLSVNGSTKDLKGCYALSNPILIIRNEVNGGEISIDTTGLVEITICVGDSLSDAFAVSLKGKKGNKNGWIITDEENNIVALSDTNVFDLEAADPGICFIYHVSFIDSIGNLEMGSSIDELSGCFHLSNSIKIIRKTGANCAPACQVDGGKISLDTTGLAEIIICAGDSISDGFNVKIQDQKGIKSKWVITDAANTILAFSDTSYFDLEGAGAGICYIWHLSYLDSVSNLVAGTLLKDLEGCLDLSNSIKVTRNVGIACQPNCEISGAEVSLDTSGTTKIEICVGDGVSDGFNVKLALEQLSKGKWITTDTTGMILALSDTSYFDLEKATPGVCYIYHLNYKDSLVGLSLGKNIDSLSGCFALSNIIRVNRISSSICNPDCSVKAGEIEIVNGGGMEISICAGDGISDAFDVKVTGAVGAKSAWIITDDDLNILGLPNSSTFDLEGAGKGICLIWHISYKEGAVIPIVGGSLFGISGCFAISNSISVNRLTGTDCLNFCGIAGTSKISAQDGTDTVRVCSDDGLDDNLEFILNAAKGDSSIWLITDLSSTILSLNKGPKFNFEGTGSGTSLLWHVVYNQPIEGIKTGGTIGTIKGCFTVSNSVYIKKLIGDQCPVKCPVEKSPIIKTIEGDDMLSVCVSEGISDNFELVLTKGDGDTSSWVITNEDGDILALPAGPVFNLQGAGAGTCLIWNVAFNDIPDHLATGHNIKDLDGCFVISDPVYIERLVGTDCPNYCIADGGTISTLSGQSNLTFCVGDVFFELKNNSKTHDSYAYAYVLTDDKDSIISWIDASVKSSFDLSEAPAGICHVWGWSHDERIKPKAGSHISTLVGVCGVLSKNKLVVNRENGGACDEGCHAPRYIRLRDSHSGRFTVQWGTVKEAIGYVIRISYEDSPQNVVDIDLKVKKIYITADPGRVVIIQIKAICRNGESEFSRKFKWGTQTKSSGSKSRNYSLGTYGLKVEEFYIMEQADLYPNPTTEFINLFYDSKADSEMAIYNLQGQKVMSKRLSHKDEYHKIDVSALYSGVYLLRISENGQLRITERFMKSDLR